MSLIIEDLTVRLSGRKLVDGVNIEIADGERVGLIGSSGSGKSMVLKSLLGLLPYGAQVSGSIRLYGQELVGIGEEGMSHIRGSYIGTIFQNPAAVLNPVLTVAQQVSLPLRLHYQLDKSQRSERVESILNDVGLESQLLNKYPSQLSGGQQQRVAIATALVTSPKVIVADEPTTALDAISQRSVVDCLKRLVDNTGASLLFVTHDFSVLSRICQRSYVLDTGKIVESGNTQELLKRPKEGLTKQLVKSARILTLHTGSQES